MTATHTAAARPRLLGLFPWLGPASLGGAQLSGRLAWESLRAVTEPRLFCYGPGAGPLEWPESVVAASRPAAVAAALARPWPADHVLVWHLHLLRLLPLFRAGRARVSLMLLGVEAWGRHDALTRLLLGRVDQFLSISDHTWARFTARYPRLAGRPHRTVHLGLGAPAPASWPAVGPLAALIVGRLARSEGYKGHRELIAAWPLVHRRAPGAELWVVGEGDLRPELEALAADRGVGEAVRFFGRVSEERKQELIAACRCLAMPSAGEGFGLVYLEAMRLGRPCLVSTLDAGREVVAPPEAGLAADPSEPQALAAALARLLAPTPEWERWCAQARARYEATFTAAHYAARLRAAMGLGGRGGG